MLKTIASNTLAQLTAKFIGAGLTFLTTALIIRLSGPSIFGDLTKSLVLIAIGFTIIDFGLNAVVVRNLGRAHNLGDSFTQLLITRLVLSFVTMGILNAIVQFLPGGYTDEIKGIFWLGSLALIFQGIYTSCNAIFQSRQNYWASTLSTIIGTACGASLTYYYILFAPSLTHFLLANTLGYLVMALVSLAMVYPLLAPFTFNPPPVRALLRTALPLGLILLASVAASKVDTIILGVYRTSAEVGEYGFAYRIFDVLLVLPVFIMNAIYPQLVTVSQVRARYLIRRSLQILGLLGVLIAIFTWFVAPWIGYVRPGLDLSITSLRLLAVSLPLFFLTAPLMWQMISLGKEKIILKIYLFAALINVVINLSYIPALGVAAAALATGVTELFILLCLLYYSYKPNKL